MTTTTSSTNEQPFAELAHRESDGVEVSLLWNLVDNSVSVFVSDTRSGDAFELLVGSENPLEVFNHPYAHAAFRGIEYQAFDRAPASV
jgi:hypothetical protein